MTGGLIRRRLEDTDETQRGRPCDNGDRLE